MQRSVFSARKTFSYRDAWSHLDAWAGDFEVKVFPERLIRKSEDFDDGGTRKGYVEFKDKGVSLRQARKLLRDNLAGSQCHHDYDCCGCSSRFIPVVWMISRGRFGYIVSTSYNY